MTLGSTWENGHAKADYNNDPLSQLLRETPHTPVIYRSSLKHLVGDVKAALLLQQIAFWFIVKGREPFYKLVAPSEDEDDTLYREGDSWVEELGFSEDEYRQALKKIATRVKKKDRFQVLSDTEPEFGLDPDKRNKHQTILLNRQHLVAYWRRSDNVLRFELNVQLLMNALREWEKHPEQEIPCSEDGKSGFENGDLPASYNRDNHIDTSKSDPADTANADAVESASTGLKAKTASTEQSETQESSSAPRARASRKTTTKRGTNVSYASLSKLGKFLVALSNKGARLAEGTETKTLTARQAEVLATEADYYDTNGEHIAISPDDLFETDPLLEIWLNTAVHPKLRGNRDLYKPLRRDWLVGAVTASGAMGIDIRNYYQWRGKAQAKSYSNIPPEEDEVKKMRALDGGTFEDPLEDLKTEMRALGFFDDEIDANERSENYEQE